MNACLFSLHCNQWRASAFIHMLAAISRSCSVRRFTWKCRLTLATQSNVCSPLDNGSSAVLKFWPVSLKHLFLSRFISVFSPPFYQFFGSLWWRYRCFPCWWRIWRGRFRLNRSLAVVASFPAECVLPQVPLIFLNSLHIRTHFTYSRIQSHPSAFSSLRSLPSPASCLFPEFLLETPGKAKVTMLKMNSSCFLFWPQYQCLSTHKATSNSNIGILKLNRKYMKQRCNNFILY